MTCGSSTVVTIAPSGRLPLTNPFLKALLAVACAALPAALSGCGEEQSRAGRVPGDTLTIFSSLPLQGPHTNESQDIVNAEKLALREAGGKVGDFKVNFASADDATAGGDRIGWDPDKTAENARKAVENTRTIAYVGDFDSGATAISLPITNEAGFAQASPASTAVGLTKFVPGAEKGEPDKFYPSGDRTFARVVPADDVQASAAARWTHSLGARRVFVIGDKSLEGDGLAELYRTAAAGAGLQVVGQDRMDPRDKDYADFVRDVARTKPDAVYFGGGVDSNAVQLWRDLSDAMPQVKLIGSYNLLEPDFYDRLGPAERQTYITSATQDPSQLPPTGQRFVRDYRREFGEAPGPYAAYGHATMKLLLDSIRRAGSDADDRKSVIDEMLDTTDLDTAVGRISIDDNGDTSLDRLAGYRVRNGRLVFDRALQGEPAS